MTQPKTAVITGASAGLGKAAARQLLDLGWRVIGVGRDLVRSDAAAAELASPRFIMLRADLASMADATRLAAQIIDLAPGDQGADQQRRGHPRHARGIGRRV
jgi:NAD(P)-dependent dehydrogenase (short-subunit alcohol dehydrogenase family)